jgi:hypothetical protein
MSSRQVGRRAAALGGLAVVVLAATTAAAAQASVLEGAGAVPSAAEALAAFRKLSKPQQAAAVTMLQQLKQGKSMRSAGCSFLIDCGVDQEEAERVISKLPAKALGVAR